MVAGLVTAHFKCDAQIVVCGSTQGTRRIKVEAREPLAMKTAILQPLAMGSRGRYALVDGIAVGILPPGREGSYCPVRMSILRSCV